MQGDEGRARGQPRLVNQGDSRQPDIHKGALDEFHRTDPVAGVDVGSTVVPPVGVLRGFRQVVRGQQRRRRRRHPGGDLPARLPSVARHRCALAAAVFQFPVAGRRIRRVGFPHHPAGVRHAGGIQGPGDEGARTQHAHHHRPPRQSHLGRPRVVPAVQGRPRRPVRGLLRLARHRRQVLALPHHLRRHGGVQLGVRLRAPAVLFPSLLLPPAGPQLREPGSARGDVRHRAVLARPRR